ncbi:MAG: hypothetical protein N4A35_01075 [Flavobacteriales bacterium]|jgi:hypothetical protein|nr:hypothetical protein [Flavobacteriales bacterium]
MKLKTLFFLLLVIPSFFAQEKDLLSIGAGVGVAGYNGDLIGNSNESILSNTKTYYNFGLERRFGKILGVELAGLLGKLSYNENTLDSISYRNFEADVQQFGINLIFNFDNDVTMKKQSPFSPYIAAGFQLFSFKSAADLVDKDGNNYHYWDDGSIRIVAQNSPDASYNTPITKRDYDFETPLSGNYNNYTFAIPATLGLKWKITERFQGRIYGTYNFLMSDYIDNVAEDDKNDSFFNGGFSLHYILRKGKTKEEKNKDLYKDVDFKKINRSDRDKDGVPDIKDDCQGTPWNAKVDKKGCPLDGDKDGVPDYKDQQLDTPEGMNVDEIGQAITDSLIQARIEEKNRIVTERKTTFSKEASTETLDNIFADIQQRLAQSNISSKKIGENMPENLKTVDTNTDGLISTQEMQDAFDGFFDGTNSFTVKDLHKLVDYFFEQ